MSDIPWDGGKPPDGLAEALADNHLGNPEVVGNLVGDFATRVSDSIVLCVKEQKSGQWLNNRVVKDAKEFGAIFTGQNPDYSTTTWNTAERAGLRTRAKALLSKSKGKPGLVDCDIDASNPVTGIFYILACKVIEAYKAAAKDEESDLPDAMQDIIKILMGWPLIDKNGASASNNKEEIITKSHVKGYMKKDGTFVSEHVRQGKPAAYHPKKSEKGHDVPIHKPDKASDGHTWDDPEKAAVFAPESPVPKELNGIDVASWKDTPQTIEGWDYVEGTYGDFDEPDYPDTGHKKLAAGVMIEEPDGRVWVISPTNKFGGYRNVFPKGTAEPGASLRGNALKEVFEESGLKVALTGFVGDFERTTSVMRLYRGKRVGGSPADMGWETQAVKLVPRDELADYLDAPADKKMLKQITE